MRVWSEYDPELKRKMRPLRPENLEHQNGMRCDILLLKARLSRQSPEVVNAKIAF